jgi:hypothetical protein
MDDGTKGDTFFGVRRAAAGADRHGATALGTTLAHPHGIARTRCVQAAPKSRGSRWGERGAEPPWRASEPAGQNAVSAAALAGGNRAGSALRARGSLQRGPPSPRHACVTASRPGIGRESADPCGAADWDDDAPAVPFRSAPRPGATHERVGRSSGFELKAPLRGR